MLLRIAPVALSPHADGPLIFFGQLQIREKMIPDLCVSTAEDRETGENDVSLRVDPRKGRDAAALSELLSAWAEQAEKYRNGEIGCEDHDKWRYNYPKYDETSGYVKVPSQQLSDALVEAFKDRLKDQ